MTETSLSLMDSLRRDSRDEDWQRLVELYSPLIRGWLRRRGVHEHDADDVAQEVFSVVIRRFPEFERNPQAGSFRAWLRTITVFCLRDYWRSPRSRKQSTGASSFLEELGQLEDPTSRLSREWDEEHDRHVTHRLLEMIRPDFEERTWRAFVAVAVDGAKPADVASILGISVNAVLIAKSRVLAKLRDVGRGLLE
jgi:RNA polymerase sigma-70 factor (ECF subfamily)